MGLKEIMVEDVGWIYLVWDVGRMQSCCERGTDIPGLIKKPRI